jgi:hypothetical protein
MTANPSKTPAIKLRRQFTLSTWFRRRTGRTRDARQRIHTGEIGAIAKWLQPRTAASFSETTLVPTGRDSLHLASDLRIYRIG